jgi:hypothetical protein
MRIVVNNDTTTHKEKEKLVFIIDEKALLRFGFPSSFRNYRICMKNLQF